MVAARIANLEPGDNQHTTAPANLPDQPAVSQARAAEMLNTSERGIERARVVVDHGTPSLVAEVETGEEFYPPLQVADALAIDRKDRAPASRRHGWLKTVRARQSRAWTLQCRAAEALTEA